MNPRSRPRRATLAAFGTAALVGLTTTGLTTPAAATPDVFHPQLVTVDTPSRADKALLQTLGLDLTEHAGQDYVEVVLHTADDVAALTSAGLGFDVRIPDLLAREAENNRANAAYAAATTTSPLPSGRDSYRTLEDYDADMAALASAHPGLVKTFSLPRPSLDGRPINGIEIGKDVTGPERGLPVFLMLGVHHAREWPSGEHAMEFAVDLVENYGTDPRITDLVNRSRVVVVPVLNVDGFDQSRTDGELIDLRETDNGGTATILGTPGNAYKRKNCRVVDGQDTPDGTCALAATSNGGYGVGVDLNRNYGGFWGGPGASDLFADPTYRGAEAFSEPETQNIRELISGRQVTTLITNHTFSNLVLRPNGAAPDLVPGSQGIPLGDPFDEAALKALGDRMAAQNGYASQHAWELYDTTGSVEDWSYNATGGFGYTFEIGPDEFHPPFPKVVDEYLGAGQYAGKGNREAFLLALENAVTPATHSVLTGKAPAGATLRLRKSFATPTWDGTIQDSLDTTMTVGADGRYTWHVNPSTRPVVMDRQVETVSGEPVAEQSWTGTTAPLQSTDEEFTVDRAVDLLEIDLDWPTPDDLDLEVYSKNADGSLTQVGSSGNSVAEKERVLLQDPALGTYVLRVINFASITPSWTLTAAQFDAAESTVPGLVENWTLTCERNGRVAQTVPIVVDRGQALRVDLTACGARVGWDGCVPTRVTPVKTRPPISLRHGRLRVAGGVAGRRPGGSMRSSRALTSGALLVVLAGTAACGVASVAPKVQLRDAFGALGDARTASFTVSLPSSEDDARAFLAASGEDGPESDDVLKELLAGEFVMSYDQGQAGDATDDAGAFQMRIDGETYGELRVVDQVVYGRVDLDGLSDRFPEMDEGLDEARTQLDAQDLGEAAAAVEAALDGEWVALDMGEGSWFAEQQEMMEGAGGPMTEEVRQQLFELGKKAFESSVSLRAAGSDDIGDRMIASVNTRELYTDLADELPDLLAGFAPGAEESMPPVEEVPDVDVQAMIWIDDDELRRFELDLAQFLEEPAGHMVLRVDIGDGGPIEAPEDAVQVDMEELVTLGTGAYEDGGGYSGADGPTDVTVLDAAYAVDGEFMYYAYSEGVAPTVEHLPMVAETFVGPPPVELLAVGERVQVTYAGETACLTLGPDADTQGTVTPGPC